MEWLCPLGEGKHQGPHECVSSGLGAPWREVVVRAKSLSYCLSLCWVVMSWMNDLVLSHTLVMGDKVVPSYFAAVSNGAMEIAWKMPAVPLG